MAISIDRKFLADAGLGTLGDKDAEDLIKQIRETLEMRVGMKIAADLSEQQLKDFEQFINKQDEEGAMGWLSTNYPTYKDVVASELAKLKGEIAKDAPTIVKELGSSK